jgi:hypothetical protein
MPWLSLLLFFGTDRTNGFTMQESKCLNRYFGRFQNNRNIASATTEK